MTDFSYSRIQLAREQFDSALKLFMGKRPRFAYSLTLAGAAEEILGRALENQGKEPALRRWHQKGSTYHRQAQTWRAHATEENFARNAIKHMREEEFVLLPDGLQYATAMMLYRACTNFELLGFEKTWRIRRFESWFYNWAT